MVLNITLGERIAQAERLPFSGTLERMVQVKKIKNVLIGFYENQLTSLNLVKVGDTYVTGKPTAGTQVTLDDDMVLAWADIIQEKSRDNVVQIDEASVFNQIIEEANRLRTPEPEPEPEPEEPNGE